MTEIEGMIRKWGNSSLAFVIPKEIAEKEKIEPNQKLKVILLRKNNIIGRTFGTLKHWKKPTERIMREIDRELWIEK